MLQLEDIERGARERPAHPNFA